MFSTAPDTSDILIREVRRWRLVAAGLAVVILVLGAFSAYLLRAIDEDYSALIDRSVPALNDLRVLGNDALSTHRSLLAALLADSTEVQDAAIARAERLIEEGGVLRRGLGQREAIADRGATPALLESKGQAYEAAAVEVLKLLKQRRSTEAGAVRQNRARPALDEYLAQIDIAARYIGSHSQTLNESISNNARSRSAFVVGVASLPIMAGVLSLVVIVGLVFLMILLFRRLGPEDGP